MKKYIIFLIFCAITFSLCAQKKERPNWVDYTSRKTNYPVERYLTGFASERLSNSAQVNERSPYLAEYAKQQLVENIMVDINSLSKIYIETNNNQSREILQKTGTSTASARIANLKTETYFDEKKNELFVFVYAPKAEVIDYYIQKLNLEIEKLENTIQSLENKIKENNTNAALTEIEIGLQTIKNIEEAQGLLIAMYANIDPNTIKWKTTLNLRAKLDALSDKVNNFQNLSIQDACSILTKALSKLNITEVAVGYLAYQDTPYSSQFARRFKQELENKLTAVQIKTVDLNNYNTNTKLLTGNYWVEQNFVRLSLILRDTKGNKLKVWEYKLPKAHLDQLNLSIEPENLQKALENSKVITNGEFKNEDLTIDVWTNKGNNNLVFVEDEKMTIAIKANRECYIRMIYYLADGQKVLLLDNYYLSTDKINQVYQLPYEFECAPPFGVETIQTLAQATPFEPLATTEQYGYKFINESTEQVLNKTRGMRLSQSSNQNLKAEKTITLTTLKK